MSLGRLENFFLVSINGQSLIGVPLTNLSCMKPPILESLLGQRVVVQIFYCDAVTPNANFSSVHVGEIIELRNVHQLRVGNRETCMFSVVNVGSAGDQTGL